MFAKFRQQGYPRLFTSTFLTLAVLALGTGLLMIPLLMTFKLGMNVDWYPSGSLRIWTTALHVLSGFAVLFLTGAIWSIHARAGWLRKMRHISGVLLLFGIIWLKSLVGTVAFVQGGILSAVDPALYPQLKIIFLLLMIGLGVKAAIVPLHGWLPKAMVAPAPVSALLHAVAVVKAGAFGIVRVIYDVYGVEFAHELGLLIALGIAASITIIYGSVRALSQDNLKGRLAYSTVSQVSYIALGATILGPIASIGGVVHLVHQGIMKITLFFAAGNYAETLGIHKVSEMNGVGKRMPGTTLAFTVGALGMIGVPPVAGFITKWYLGLGALDAGIGQWILPVLLLSSLLNAAYFLPILYRAWFKDSEDKWPDEMIPARTLETHGSLLWPPIITAILALAVGLFAAAPYSPLEWSQLIAFREYGQ